MALKINTKQLHSALKVVAPVIKSNSTLEILKFALIDIHYCGIQITGSNSVTQLTTLIIFDDEIPERFEFAIDFEKFIKIVEKLGDKNGSLIINDDHIELRVLRSKYKIKTLPAEQFPLMELPNNFISFDMSSSDIKNIIKTICPVELKVKIITNKSGICLDIGDFPGKIHAIAINSVMFGNYTADIKNGEKKNNYKMKELLVNGDNMKLLSSILSDEAVHVLADETSVSFRCANNIAITRMMNHNYINWRAVPSDTSIEFKCDKAELLDACDRVLVAISDQVDIEGRISKTSWFHFHNDKLEIIADGVTSSGNEEIKIHSDVVLSVPLETGFNISYFKHILNSINSDQIEIGMDQSNLMKPMVVEHGNSQFLLAPCRR